MIISHAGGKSIYIVLDISIAPAGNDILNVIVLIYLI